MNSEYQRGYLTLAYAQLGLNQIDEAHRTYSKLEKIGAIGASMAASGLADLAVYQGQYRNAVRLLEQSVASDLNQGSTDAAADKYSALASIQMLLGQTNAALAAVQRALELSRTVKTRFLAARVYVEAGDMSNARTLASGLSNEIRAEPQSYAKLIEGEIALKGGDPKAAVQSFIVANRLFDTWIGHFDLSRAYLEVPVLSQADAEFGICIRRRGEAIELFMDDVPTYGYFPVIYYYVGRVREELKAPDYKDLYRTYLDIRGKAGEDPLLPQVRRRVP
jgi:tetratricopeptide (TPR) repeat protein